MTTLGGHATPRERERAAALEAKLQAQSASLDEQLELALLYLEPGHDGFRAAELLERILKTEPEHDLARLWLAHCWIYEWMDENALRNAVTLCDALTDASKPAPVRSAALLLKATALRQLGGDGEVIELLSLSVELAPSG